MTIAMQGTWTVSVKSKSAAWPQRFRIVGSTNGVDDEYDHDDARLPVTVTGPQWGITVQHNPPGPVSWRQSRYRLANWQTSDSEFSFDIESDDFLVGGGDEDFNDLILTCTAYISFADFIVYGQVKSYEGYCSFNPCFPATYYVIDQAWQFEQLLKYAPTRQILEKLYPERVREFEQKAPVPPVPPPDPAPFRPMMIPSGLSAEPGLYAKRPPQLLEESEVKRGSIKRAAMDENREANGNGFTLAPDTTAGTAMLEQEELSVLARMKGKFRLRPCVVSPVSQTLMRFIEYDRTASELLGDPYSGEGIRHTLGTTATDEFGNYIFRFSLDFEYLVGEFGDVAADESLSTALWPDLIIQLLESVPDSVMFETAPYYNIPNIKRINLCVPSRELDPPRTSCQGGRAIQALGNLFIISGGTELHADGTVTNINLGAPIVDHAAWFGWVDLFACFLDLEDPRVTYYVIRHRREEEAGWTDWSFVTQNYSHDKKQEDGTWLREKVGPHEVELRVNDPGDPKVLVNAAYLNIEYQILHYEWLNTHRDRKLQIHTPTYQPAAGPVEFRIEGYDGSGEKVPGAEDTIRLYIDNTWSKGDIEYVKLGVEDPGECALFELPTAGEPLTVKYRATDVEGFMLQYALNVYRGSNTDVVTHNAATGSPVSVTYGSALPFDIPDRFRGTLDETLDPDGYLEISLVPAAGSSWLPPEVEFCAFSFELTATDRKTNGYDVAGGRTLWRELIGISYSPPGP